MPIGLLTLEIHIPDTHSLKEKRVLVRKMKDRLRARFNVAVAELDHQDLWQRSVLGIVSIASDTKVLERLMESVQLESEKILGGDLVRCELELF